MGINSTAMRILIEKGLSIHDILEVAEALEGHIPERFKARQKVEASKNSSDPHIRPSSSWKKRAFNRIAERDGLYCARCYEPEGLMVRRGRQVGCFEDGTAHTIVHITSDLELDHYIPLWDGWSNDDDNLNLVCNTCHKIKSSIESSNRAYSKREGRLQ